jgi:lipoyl(octanoyl) transferase
MQKIKVQDLGVIKYAAALDIQTQKFNELIDTKMNERSNSDAHFLYLCQHTPVITLGKAANQQNILLSEEFLKEKDIDVFHINRGGDVTFHGPGQLTGYPILDLEFFSSDLKVYMRMLEEVMILTIANYGIEGYRIADATGVWVNSKNDNQPKKIAAFGVKTSRWITMHGFALNVDVDLHYFNYINPCGFTDKGVTSIKNETENEVDINEVKRVLLDNFALVFESDLVNQNKQEISNIDKRNQLQENPFAYKITKDNKVIIYRNNKQIKIIPEKQAVDFIKLVNQDADEVAIQLTLAKLTGNYKHGNEKLNA